MANEYIRKEWTGGATRTTLNGTTTAVATSINVLDATTFPVGTFPFVCVIDRGQATEEKILCSGRGASSLTVLARGYDGSTAAAHASGAYVEHVLDAYTVDQVNAMASKMTTAGDLLYKTTTGDNTAFSRLAMGTAGHTLLAGAGAPSWGQLTGAGLANGAVSVDKIVDFNVTTAKINNLAVGTNQLADLGVTTVKLADLNVTTGKIADANVTAAKVQVLTNGHVLAGNAGANAVVPSYSAGTFANRPAGAEGMLYYAQDQDITYIYEGAAWWVWEASGTETPALVGMAIGTGGGAINTCTWNFSGRILTVTGSIVFGTAGTTFPAATITAAVPAGFTSDIVGANNSVGIATMGVGASNFKGVCWLATSTTLRFVVENVAGTYSSIVATSTTVPGTWAAGDTIRYWAAFKAFKAG